MNKGKKVNRDLNAGGGKREDESRVPSKGFKAQEDKVDDGKHLSDDEEDEKQDDENEALLKDHKVTVDEKFTVKDH